MERKQFKDISWDADDLISSKNAVLMIAEEYGVGWVWDLDAEYAFGNLDVDDVLLEAGFLDQDDIDAIYGEDQASDSINDTMEKVYDFPSWAVYYAMYGEWDDLTEEEKEMVDSFMDENGYTDLVEVSEEITDFCRYPAFGKPCEVYDWVIFHKNNTRYESKEDNGCDI